MSYRSVGSVACWMLLIVLMTPSTWISCDRTGDSGSTVDPDGRVLSVEYAPLKDFSTNESGSTVDPDGRS